MPRTDATNVGLICEVDEGDDLTAFILTANELVTEICASVLDADGNARYSSTRLELIERWLAAHFYKQFNKEAGFEAAGRVQVSYQYKVALIFQNTMYGQQALALDTAGGLAALSKRTETGSGMAPGLSWLGTTAEA